MSDEQVVWCNHRLICPSEDPVVPFGRPASGEDATALTAAVIDSVSLRHFL